MNPHPFSAVASVPTTMVFTHAIIGFSKIHHLITDIEQSKLTKVSNGAIVDFGRFKMNTSDIAQILTLSDYYEQFPDKRPVDTRVFEPDPVPHVPVEKIAALHENALRGLVAGLAYYVEKHGATPNNMFLFSKHKKTYQEQYGQDFTMKVSDTQRVVAAFTEKDSQQVMKIPCHPCIGNQVLEYHRQFNAA